MSRISDIKKKILWEKIRNNNNEYICPYCDLPINKENERDWNVDHIVPKSKGGTTEIENLTICHRQCNTIKGDNDGNWIFEIKKEKELKLNIQKQKELEQKRAITEPIDKTMLEIKDYIVQQPSEKHFKTKESFKWTLKKIFEYAWYKQDKELISLINKIDCWKKKWNNFVKNKK